MRFVRDIVLCLVLGILLLASFVLGGCAETNPIGPSLEQASDAGTTRLVNQPPGAIAIREEGLNWVATGTANVKASKIGPDGVMHLGSGPATRQLLWNQKTGALAFSSETDVRVDSFSAFGPGGTPLYEVRGFSTNASDPTRALAAPLAAWGVTLEALSLAELQALQTKLEEQAWTAREVLPKVADLFGQMAGIVGDIMKARAAVTPAK